MYPGTIFNWHDQSVITTTGTVSLDNAPLFLTASSFDKGPEDLRVVRGQSFFDLYGNLPSFAKHGQPAIQAANIINAGGSLLIKRLVAADATLANTILVATVTSNIVATPIDPDDTTTEGKTKDEILNIFSNQIVVGDGEEQNPTEPTDDPVDPTPDPEPEVETKYTVKINTKLSWSAVSVTGAKTINDVYEFATTLVENDGVEEQETPDGAEAGQLFFIAKEVIPTVVGADNGRGVSNKSIRFIPDYTTSRDSENFFYNIRVFEGTSISDRAYASLNPDSRVGNTNYGISSDTCTQINLTMVNGAYEELLDVMSKASGIPADSLKAYDLMFGYNNRKVAIPGVEIDEESIDLNSTYGVNLENGSNGSFGDAPFGTDAYNDAAAWFFYPVVEDDPTSSGEGSLYDYEGSDRIFDVDEFKIAACFDANYAPIVKNAIAKLVTFREDFFFFRDLGLDVFNYTSIVQAVNENKIRNRFIGDYCTTYQIYSPTDRKRIRVTMMYDFSAAMVNHFLNGPYRPLAGSINDMVLPSAIEGTVNFTPRITPVVNQKDLMETARVNYAIFQSGRCIVQSLYSSQDAYTQLSYINNVLGIQQVIRAVRTACPKFRYTFITNNDFTSYKEAVTNVLANFLSNFAELSFEYEEDDILAAQKIFYGVINFRFNNWAQTEVFDVYALPVETTANS